MYDVSGHIYADVYVYIDKLYTEFRLCCIFSFLFFTDGNVVVLLLFVQMRIPAIQNDFSYYRRTISRNRINNMNVRTKLSSLIILKYLLLSGVQNMEKRESSSLLVFSHSA